MKSTTTMPPMLRNLSWRGIAVAASRLVFSAVSARLSGIQGRAAVHVDGGHGLGVLDYDLAAAWEFDAGVEDAVQIRFHAKGVEQRSRALVAHDLVAIGGEVRLDMTANARPGVVIVDEDSAQSRSGQVADRAQHDGQFLEQQRRCLSGA